MVEKTFYPTSSLKKCYKTKEWSEKSSICSSCKLKNSCRNCSNCSDSNSNLNSKSLKRN